MELNNFNFVENFEKILKVDKFNGSIDFSLKKYNLKDNKFSTIIENADFRCDLYETLKNLLIFYDEGEYYQEKYILLILHLIFGVNPNEKNKTTQKSLKNQNIKNKNLIISNLDDNYIEQYEKIEELTNIIFNTIIKIQEIQQKEINANENEINDNNDINNINDNNINNINELDNSSSEEDIEYKFEGEIKEFFLKHYSLFFHCLHKLINTLYSQMEIGVNDSRDYVLFIKILCENKINFRPLILTKFNRTLNNYNNEELELLSLFDEINFTNPYDLIKTNQRLKSLIYIVKQKSFNNSILYYDNIKYVNEHFLSSKYKISEKQFNNIYIKNKDNLYDKSEQGKQNNKIKIQKQIENIKNNIERITYDYQNDLNMIKNQIFQLQNKFSNNIKQLNSNLINLNLELEKMED